MKRLFCLGLVISLVGGFFSQPALGIARRIKFVGPSFLEPSSEYAKRSQDYQLRMWGNMTVKSIVNVNLGQFLGDIGRIPDEVVGAAEQSLSGTELKGYKVSAAGGDLLLDIVTYDQNSDPETVRTIALRAIEASLQKARELGIYQAPVDKDVLSVEDLDQKLKMLEFRMGSFGYDERKAEPIGVYKIVGAGMAAFDPFLYWLSMPTHVSGLERDRGMVQGFIYEIEDSQDVIVDADGKVKHRTFFLDLPSDLYKLGQLVGDTSRFHIKRIWAKPGSKLPLDQPVAEVFYEYTYDQSGEATGNINPVLVIRGQSTAYAIGEILMGIRDPYVVPGGSDDAYYVPIMPVSQEVGRQSPSTNVAYLMGYGYQSRDNGFIPPHQVDPFDNTVFDSLRERALEFARILARHGNFTPNVTPEHARQVAEETRQANLMRFTPVPSPQTSPETKLTLSVIKADIGSAYGHIDVPQELFDEMRRVLDQAKNLSVSEWIELYREELAEAGVNIDLLLEKSGSSPLLVDYQLVRVGDDMEIKMKHYQNEDSDAIHFLAWQALNAAGDKAIEMQLYGAKQDILVEAFAGNVRGAGPGSAELALEEDEPFLFLAMDKTAPSAFSIPSIEMAERALLSGKYPNGFVFEVWHLRPEVKPLVAEDIYNLFQGEDQERIMGLIEEIRGGLENPEIIDLKTLYLGIAIQAARTIKGYDQVFKKREDIKKWFDQKADIQLSDEQLDAIEIAARNFRADHPFPYTELLTKLLEFRQGTEKIYLDFASERDTIEKLLADYDNYAVRSIYAKAHPGWNPVRAEDYLGKKLAAFSTDRLSLVAGEYVGKDDPAGIVLWEFAQNGEIARTFTNPYVVDGWMRGSHRGPLYPHEYEEAIPTLNDGPPIAVGLVISTAEDGKFGRARDLFSGEEFELARRRARQIMEYMLALGVFTPYRLVGEAAEYTALPELITQLRRDPVKSAYLPFVLYYLLQGRP